MANNSVSLPSVAARRVAALIAIVSCAGVVSGLRAQSHYPSRIFVGAHGGADFSRVSFTPSVTQSFLVGGNAGLNFRYIEEKHFGFIVEANWEQRGWKEDFEDKPYSYSRSVDFIQIPVLAHIYFGNRGKFFINAGPSVSFMIGERTRANFDYDNVSSNPDFDTHITYQYALPADRKVDYGISGGIGGEFSVDTRNSLYIDARFYFGLGDLVKSGRTEPVRGSNPMTISLSLGYWFRIK